MNTLSYLIIVAFYILGGLYVNILMRRILSHWFKTNLKLINTVSMAVALVLSLGGVSLSTLSFFYLHN